MYSYKHIKLVLHRIISYLSRTKEKVESTYPMNMIDVLSGHRLMMDLLYPSVYHSLISLMMKILELFEEKYHGGKLMEQRGKETLSGIMSWSLILSLLV